MRPGILLAAAAVVALPGCQSCKSADPVHSDAPSSSAIVPSVGGSSSARPTASGAESPNPKAPACWALAVKGEIATLGGTRISFHSPVDGATWLRLSPGAELNTRHAVSTREFSSKGPSLVLPCVGGEEDWAVAEGGAESISGAGARPGAEVFVFTPFGAVSYGDARIAVNVTKSKVEILAIGGEGWVTAAAGAHRTGPEKVAGPKGKAALSGSPNPSALVESCEKAAANAEARATAVLSQGAISDGGTLGDRAAEHLRARRAARIECGSARAALPLAKDESQRRDLDARLGRAERRWKAIPSLGPAPAPPKSSGG